MRNKRGFVFVFLVWVRGINYPVTSLCFVPPLLCLASGATRGRSSLRGIFLLLARPLVSVGVTAIGTHNVNVRDFWSLCGAAKGKYP